MANKRVRKEQTFPKENNEKELKETIRTLKSQVRRLQKEIRELKSKNKDLEKVWEKTQEYLSESLEDVSLEELIRRAGQQEKAPKKVKASKKKEPVNDKEEVRKRFAAKYGRKRESDV